MNVNKEKIEAFELDEVGLLEPYLLNALEKETNYLLSFDNDKWLAGFRETAGLPMKNKTRYAGWEDMLIGGHAFGHYLTAVSQASRNSNVSEENRKRFKDIVIELIDELNICQAASRGKDGFLFAAKILDDSNVEIQFDNVEKGLCDIFKEAWVPYYTMHKILQGIIDAFVFTGYGKALNVAHKLGLWVYNRVIKCDTKTRNTVLSIEYGGMNDCLYELYHLTGDERIAKAAHFFDEETLFIKILSDDKNVLNNKHANTTIPKFLGALKRYCYVTEEKKLKSVGNFIANDITNSMAKGMPSDISNSIAKGMSNDSANNMAKCMTNDMYLESVKAFFDMVVERHTYITGGNSEWEHFGEDYVLDRERTNANNETCNVYNMMKMARLLFMITGEKKYADYYENAYINSILSSQNPESGMTTYFQPMATGYFKVYGERYNKFWCCVGTGMENFTKLGDSIYFKSASALYVNLYLSSTVYWKERNFKLVQDSEVLKGGKIKFRVEETDGEKVSLMFRVPDWAAAEVVVKLGEEVSVFSKELDYISVERAFKAGDVIEFEIPMEIKAYSLPDNEKVIGFKYGPMVLSGNLGQENMTKSVTGVDVTIPEKSIVKSEIITLPEGVSEQYYINNINEFVVKEEKKSEFIVKGCEYVFAPHYLKYNERYGIYWYLR
ncbi:MAG: glycoside hydrolase family 127 protein [Lachnospiraceae bacterium]|nr:glycoside hydrolase family 127 protein [Lachnospiraceae bacterium]